MPSFSVRPGHGSELVVEPVEVEAGEGADDGEDDDENAPADKTRTPKLSSDFMLPPPVEYEQEATCFLKRSLS